MIYPCFKGKVALITGGTRGIGYQVAEYLAASGCALALIHRRDRETAEAVEKELSKYPVGILTIKSNLADEHSIPEIIAEVHKRYERLDYLVSNAVFGVLKPVGEFTGKRFDISMDTNARAYLLLAQSAADLMVPKGAVDDPWETPNGPLPATKRMVALSSLGSIRHIPGYAAIAASKAALETITRYLAVELAPRGIGVNTVSAGLVKTDSLLAFRDQQEWVKSELERTPLGRIAQASDVAKVVVWLLSDQASWITGQTIIADGGVSLM